MLFRSKGSKPPFTFGKLPITSHICRWRHSATFSSLLCPIVLFSGPKFQISMFSWLFSVRNMDISDEIIDIEMSNNDSDEKGVTVTEVNPSRRQQQNNKEPRVSQSRRFSCPLVSVLAKQLSSATLLQENAKCADLSMPLYRH